MSVLGQIVEGGRVLGASRASSATVFTFVDNGTGSDSVSRVVTTGKTDTGTATDSLTRNVSDTKTDAGIGTDARGFVATKGLQDSGGGSDAATFTDFSNISDSGAGTDAIGRAVTISTADTGAGADTPTLVQPPPSGNTGNVGWFGSGTPTRVRRRHGRVPPLRQRSLRPTTVTLDFADLALGQDASSWLILVEEPPLLVSDILTAALVPADDLQNQVVELLVAGVI